MRTATIDRELDAARSEGAVRDITIPPCPELRRQVNLADPEPTQIARIASSDVAMARQDRSFTETENRAHRTDHAVVGAIVARTWRLPGTLAHAVRLHHDFSVLVDKGIAAEVRTLVAAGLVAEYLVQNFEGLDELKEWRLHGPACLAYLQVEESELSHWADALVPEFESAAVV